MGVAEAWTWVCERQGGSTNVWTVADPLGRALWCESGNAGKVGRARGVARDRPGRACEWRWPRWWACEGVTIVAGTRHKLHPAAKTVRWRMRALAVTVHLYQVEDRNEFQTDLFSRCCLWSTGSV